jgi:hypothetical protein
VIKGGTSSSSRSSWAEPFRPRPTPRLRPSHRRTLPLYPSSHAISIHVLNVVAHATNTAYTNGEERGA